MGKNIKIDIKGRFGEFSKVSFNDKNRDEFLKLLDEVTKDNKKVKKFKDCIASIAWSSIVSNALRSDKFEIVEEIMDLLYGKTESRKQFYEGAHSRICRYKLLYGREGIENNNGMSINMGLIIGELKNLKDRSQIKKFFLLENNFDFIKNIKPVGRIIESLLKEENIDYNTKDLLSFFKERGVFKNFHSVFEDSSNEERKGEFSFFDIASKEMFRYLVVDCDFFGDYLGGKDEQKTSLVKEAIESKEYKKLEILFQIPGINRQDIIKVMNKKKVNIEKDLKKALGQERGNEYFEKLKSIINGQERENELKSGLKNELEQENVVDIQSYVNAIQNGNNVIEIFEKFGIEGNPTKEEGVVVLLTAIKEYKQSEKVNRYYEILKEEINSLDIQIDWNKIIVSVVMLKELDILNRFLDMIKEKEYINRVNIDWNRIFSAVYYNKDEKSRISILNTLMERCEDIFGTKWEKELIHMYGKGNRCVVMYLRSTYDNKFNKVLLVKEAIKEGNTGLVNIIMDGYRDSNEVHSILRNILPYAYKKDLDIFENLVVKYGDKDIRKELFGILYENKSTQKWTFIKENTDKKIRLQKRFLSNAISLMYICESVIELKYLESNYNLNLKVLKAEDLMFEACLKEDLDLIKYLLPKVDKENLNRRWINQLERSGNREIYSEVIKYIVDKKIEISFDEENYLKALAVCKKLNRKALEYMVFNEGNINSINSSAIVAKTINGEQITPEVLKNMKNILGQREGYSNGEIPRIYGNLSREEDRQYL